jgi:hypothetical protein
LGGLTGPIRAASSPPGAASRKPFWVTIGLSVLFFVLAIATVIVRG